MLGDGRRVGEGGQALAEWVPKFVNRLQDIPQLHDVASDLQESGLQATLVLDRATASRLGITPQMLDDALYDAFGQRQVSTIFTQLNQYHVVLEAKPGSEKTWVYARHGAGPRPDPRATLAFRLAAPGRAPAWLEAVPPETIPLAAKAAYRVYRVQ